MSSSAAVSPFVFLPLSIEFSVWFPRKLNGNERVLISLSAVIFFILIFMDNYNQTLEIEVVERVLLSFVFVVY